MLKRKWSTLNALIKSDKEAALHMLTTANINDTVNINYLNSFPNTMLTTISTAMVTLAKKNHLNEQTRSLLKLAGHQGAWEVSDIYIRFANANCLTSDLINALFLACKTSFLQHPPRLIHKNLCGIIGYRLFNQASLKQKVELCSLALAIPNQIKIVTDLLSALKKKKYLNDTIFAKIIKIGFLLAAEEITLEAFAALTSPQLLTATSVHEIISLLQIPPSQCLQETVNVTQSQHGLFPNVPSPLPPVVESPGNEQEIKASSIIFGCQMV